MNSSILLAIALAASVPTLSDAPAAEALIGRWELTEAARVGIPEACHGMAYEITRDSITTESGALRVVASYQADHDQAVTTVRQSNLRHNGQPNCQGRPAEYVAERFVMNLEMEIVDDRLRLYIFRKSDGKYLELERASGTP